MLVHLAFWRLHLLFLSGRPRDHPPSWYLTNWIFYQFRRIYGPKYEGGEWKSRTNGELEELSKGENIVKWIKGQRIFFLLLHRACCYYYFFYSNSCTFLHIKNTNSSFFSAIAIALLSYWVSVRFFLLRVFWVFWCPLDRLPARRRVSLVVGLPPWCL